MDNIETFRERLLQDEALQRSLHHQRDVVADAFIEEPDADRKKKRKKERQKERQL